MDLERAISFINRGDLVQGISILKQVLKKAERENDHSTSSYANYILGQMAGCEEKYEDALGHYKQALAYLEGTDEEAHKADIWYRMGWIYFRVKNYKEALKCFQKDLEISKGIKDFKGFVDRIDTISETLQRLGRFKEALEIYEGELKAIESYVVELDKEEKGFVLDDIARIYSTIGKYNEALEYNQKAIEFFEKNNNMLEKIKAMGHRALIQFYAGEFEQAVSLHQLCCDLCEKNNFLREKASFLLNQGATYTMLERFQDAFNVFQESLRIQEENKSYDQLSNTLIQIGELYEKFWRIKYAINHYRRALQIAEELRDSACIAKSKQNIARILGKVGRKFFSVDDELSSHFYNALKISDEIADLNLKAEILWDMGTVYRDNDSSYKKASEMFQESLQIFNTLENNFGKGRALFGLGEVFQKENKLDEAIDHYQQALEVLRKAKQNSELRARILTALGTMYQARGDYRKATDSFIEALDIMELLISSVSSEEIRKSYRVVEIAAFKGIIESFIEWSKKEQNKDYLLEVVRYLDLIKAREIADKIKTDELSIETCPELNELIEKEQKLIEERMRLERLEQGNELFSKTGLGEGEERLKNELKAVSWQGLKLAGGRQNPYRGWRIEKLMHEWKKTRAQILERCKDPGLRRNIREYNPIPDLQHIFEQEDVVSWQFIYFPDRIEFDRTINVWTFSKDEEYKPTLEWESSDVEFPIKEILPKQFTILVWDGKNIDIFESNEFDNEEVLELLYQFHEQLSPSTLNRLKEVLGTILPEKLIATLEGKKKLLLIPHNVLHLYPWELITALSLKIPLVRSYSLELIRSCMKREQLTKDVLFIVNPNFNHSTWDLPGAEEEAHSIIALLKSVGVKYNILERGNAKEQAFTEITQKEFGIIHFAGHGIYDTDDPWLSGILFYHPDSYDIRTVTELVRQRFKGTPLFILSACETGRSKFSRGDEMIGLIRGLTLAGATSIIATNWVLADQVAPHFMKAFYNHFLQGKDAGESLFEARKQIYNTISKDPFDWGVYALFGNPFKMGA